MVEEIQKQIEKKSYYEVQLDALNSIEHLEDKKKYIKTIDTSKSFDVQRYKGLGEMNPQQLWDTTMNPETRLLKRITITDAIKADEIFRVLMSEDVPPRKKFIQTHAHLAKLDI